MREQVADTDGEKLREFVMEEQGEVVGVKGWDVAMGENVTVGVKV